MAEHEFDYLIVGAGSAGCVLANRLGEDPAVGIVVGGSPNAWHRSSPLSSTCRRNFRFWKRKSAPAAEPLGESSSVKPA